MISSPETTVARRTLGAPAWTSRLASGAALLLFLGALVASGGAAAHKLKAFATAEGAKVEGYAYFTPGGRAHQADVTVTAGPDASVVLKTGVTPEGDFSFTAKQHIDYVITVDGGDSHIASYTVHAAELPDTLPTPTDGTILPLDSPTLKTPPSDSASAPTVAEDPVAGAGVTVDPKVLRELIRESVAREVNPLREQLDEFKESVTWHDVLGGIGYIFGLCGVAFWFAGRRADSKRPSNPTIAHRTALKEV